MKRSGKKSRQPAYREIPSFVEKVEALYPQLVEIYNTMSKREGFEAYSRVWLPAPQDELPSLFTALYYDMITPQEACERLTEAAAR